MEDRHKKIININRLYLIRNIVLNEELLSDLRRDDIVTLNVYEEMENLKPSDRRVGYLLDNLARRGKKAFGRLIEALRESGQDHVATTLDPDGEFNYAWMNNMEDILDEIQESKIMDFKMVLTPDDVRSKLQQSPNVYPFSRKERGYALIINNHFFSGFGLKNRDGATLDGENLKKLFENLNFKTVYSENLNSKVMVERIREAGEHVNSGDYDIFVLALMSHGLKGVVFGIDGNVRDSETIANSSVDIYRTILPTFDDQSCPGMAGKPKLFFVQACQGDQKSAFTSNETDAKKVVKWIHEDDAIWNKHDILLAFATATDYVALRNEFFGSVFIRCIVYVFSKRSFKDDIISLMTQVCFIVSKMRLQVPERKDTLSKKLYLMP